MPKHDRDASGPSRGGRPRASAREVLRLIRAAYAVSLPYFLVLILVLALATWVLTTLVF